jgi:hypothetical protein
LVIKFKKVGVESNFLRFHDVLIFGFKFFSQESVLIDDLLSEFKQSIAIVFEFVKLVFQKLYFKLIGHEEGFNVVEFLEMVLGVDQVDVLDGLCLSHREACLLAQCP